MFGLGFVEILLIAVLALIFIGPKQLPEVARVIARLMNEWRRATRELTSSLTEAQSDLHRRIHEPPPPPPAAATETPAPNSDDQKKES